MYVSVEVPELAREFGFAVDPGGTHTSRTMMLSELRLLLAVCAPTAAFSDYRSAIADDNVLLKETVTTRLRSLRGLRELYALDRKVPVFRALRDLWDASTSEQPLLALLCATARDPLLRATASMILSVSEGASVTPAMLAEPVNEYSAGRYNSAILAKIGRNAASSWQQSGHLQGRLKKLRVRATAGPAATTYALLLGHLCGIRGAALFNTFFTQLLDTPPSAVDSLAFMASQRGWLDYRRIGDVADIGFSWLMRTETMESIHG